VATPFEVFLVTPEREVWSGQATIVIARGTEGEVGVQAGHTPMLLQLGISPLFIQTEQERIAAAIDGGFLHVVSSGMDTRVDILAEHAELSTEIDVDKARQQKEDAERRVASNHDATAEADLAKALVRLDLRS
jgi:F-type H+-transporting ATPase subunit epsilon